MTRTTRLMATLAALAASGAVVAACGQQIPTGSAPAQPVNQEQQQMPIGAPNDQVDQQWLTDNTQRGTDVLAQAQLRLGDAWGGGYLDGTSRTIVVLSTDAARSGEIAALGAEVRQVENSAAELDDWQREIGVTLGAQPPAQVTSWGVDVRRNVVVVDVLAGQPVPADLTALADSAGGAILIEEADGPVVPLGPAGG